MAKAAPPRRQTTAEREFPRCDTWGPYVKDQWGQASHPRCNRPFGHLGVHRHYDLRTAIVTAEWDR